MEAARQGNKPIKAQSSMKGMLMPSETLTRPEPAIRPFGLSRTTPRTGAGFDNPADTAVYDPAQQFNVAADGVALVTTELGQVGVTHQDTQADHQHWTDKD